MTDTVVVTANAKVTLSLQITGVRADGYHELDALVVSVNAPQDTVRLRRAATTTLEVRGRASDDVPADASNLAVRAADALGVTASIVLDKGIAAGAGLGGGSADAAAVLVGLRALYELPHDDGALATLGARLGADVPACLHGGPMRMRGAGEQIDACELPALRAVVVTPPFGCATAAVYRAWDDLGSPRGRGVETGVDDLPALRNDLEPAAWNVEPRLEALHNDLERAAGAPAVLAGSGSSYVVVFTDDSAAREAARRVRASAVTTTWGARVVSGRTMHCGVFIR